MLRCCVRPCTECHKIISHIIVILQLFYRNFIRAVVKAASSPSTPPLNACTARSVTTNNGVAREVTRASRGMNYGERAPGAGTDIELENRCSCASVGHNRVFEIIEIVRIECVCVCVWSGVEAFGFIQFAHSTANHKISCPRWRVWPAQLTGRYRTNNALHIEHDTGTIHLNPSLFSTIPKMMKWSIWTQD